MLGAVLAAANLLLNFFDEVLLLCCGYCHIERV